MSRATLRRIPLPALGPRCRRIEVDCPHAVTGATILEGATTTHVEDADAVRMILARHHAEGGCRCTRKLWQRYFGGEQGKLVLVKGEPHV